MATRAQETLTEVMEQQGEMTPEDRFIEEQIEWLKAHKAETGASFTEIASWTGIAHGTVSNLLGKGYAGNRKRYADMIAKYRHTLESQSEVVAEARAETACRSQVV